jgi:hypothetical protein
MEEFKSKVAPLLVESTKEGHRRISEALKAATVINWRFHRACAQRYYDVVTELATKSIGPFDPA